MMTSARMRPLWAAALVFALGLATTLAFGNSDGDLQMLQ